MRFALLDVGHGNGAVLHNETNAVLFDAPPGNEVASYLSQSGIRYLDEVFISHADKDHLFGLARLVKAGIKVGRLWINDDQDNESIHYKWLVKLFASQRAAGDQIARGHPNADVQPLVLGDVQIEILAPHHEDVMSARSSNSLSVVLRISARGEGIALLPGDLDRAGLERLLPTVKDYSAYWLVAPHHGGLGGVREGDGARLMSSLLALTGAKEVFFSFLRGISGTPRPREEILQVIRQHKAVAVRCSGLSRRCVADSELGLLDGNCTRHRNVGRAHSPSGCVACAGTVLIDTNYPQAWPGEFGHSEFITGLRTLGLRPQCFTGP